METKEHYKINIKGIWFYEGNGSWTRYTDDHWVYPYEVKAMLKEIKEHRKRTLNLSCVARAALTKALREFDK